MRFGGIVWMLNQILNPNHNWTDYDSEPPFSRLSNIVGSLTNKLTGAGLTGAEKEANEFNAEEAQKSRDFTEYMTRNKYQMETQSMEQAGINPAMVYGGGQLVPTTTNGAQGASVAPSEASLFDVLPVLARLPKEIDVLKSEAARNRAEGTAAIINARSNQKNAESNARNAESQSRLASVAELKVQIESRLADSGIEVNSAQVQYMAKQTDIAQKQFEQMDQYLAIAQQNADAQSQSAIASLQSAMAAVENAETNKYLSAYQAAMYKGQAMLYWSQGEGQSIMNQFLDEKTQAEIDLLVKQGVKVDKEGNLIDKQGKLCTAETVATYTHAVAEVSQEANRWVTTFVPNFRTIVKPLGK